MQNKFKTLLLSLICAVTFVSCQNPTGSTGTGESSSINESESESTNSSTPSEDVSVDELDPEYNDLPNWQIVRDDISTGGDLLDIEIGRDFMTGAEYDISFSLGSSMPVDPSQTKVVSSNEKVFVVEKLGNGYKIKALHRYMSYFHFYPYL